MCLVCKKRPELLIAKEDIKVFKVVCYRDEGGDIINDKKTVLSYYRNYRYTAGKVYIQPTVLEAHKHLKALRNGDTLYVTNEAFHSYSFDVVRFIENKNLFCGELCSFNGQSYEYKGDPFVLALFVIPRGSKYYLEDNCYASDSIIYTGIQYNVEPNTKTLWEVIEKLENE